MLSEMQIQLIYLQWLTNVCTVDLRQTPPEWQLKYTTRVLKLAEIYSTEHRQHNSLHSELQYIKVSNWASEESDRCDFSLRFEENSCVLCKCFSKWVQIFSITQALSWICFKCKLQGTRTNHMTHYRQDSSLKYKVQVVFITFSHC